MSVDVRQFARLVRLSPDQVQRRLAQCQRQGWAVIIEHTADASAANRLWERWGVPIHDASGGEAVLHEIHACRRAHPTHYIRVNACQVGRGQAVIRNSFLVHSPEKPLATGA